METDRTPSQPTKSFPSKSPRVKLSGRPPVKLYGHEKSHPLELRVCLSQTLRNPTLSRRTGRIVIMMIIIIMTIMIYSVLLTIAVTTTIIVSCDYWLIIILFEHVSGNETNKQTQHIYIYIYIYDKLCLLYLLFESRPRPPPPARPDRISTTTTTTTSIGLFVWW